MFQNSVPIATIRDLSIQLQPSVKRPLHAWLGSSIRGWLMGALKGIQQSHNDQKPLDPGGLCRLAHEFPKAADADCQQCSFRPNCAYGMTFAGAMRAPGDRGLRQATALSPACFLSPMIAGADLNGGQIEMSVGIQLIGHGAIAHTSDIVSRLSAIGESTIGGHAARLRTRAAYISHEYHGLDTLIEGRVETEGQLPISSDQTVEKLVLTLESPLFLKSKHESTFQNDHEVFAFLFIRCVSVIETLVDQHFHQKLRIQQLFPVAKQVRCEARYLNRFQQVSKSARSRVTERRNEYDRTGWTGQLVFPNVPVLFLPWFRLAGVIGIGQHRSSGAGRWSTIIL